MSADRKRLMVGFAVIALLDFSGLVTMIANPDLTSRVIPALAGVQIFGFIAIAVIVVLGRRNIAAGEANRIGAGKGNEWVPWLFGFLALMSFMRVGLTILSVAGEEGHRHSWFGPMAGTAMGCVFLGLAIVAGRSVSRKRAMQRTEK